MIIVVVGRRRRRRLREGQTVRQIAILSLLESRRFAAPLFLLQDAGGSETRRRFFHLRFHFHRVRSRGDAQSTFRPGRPGAAPAAASAAAAVAPLLPQKSICDEGVVLLAFEYRAAFLGVQR